MKRCVRVAPVLAGMFFWSGCELLFPFTSDDFTADAGGGSSGAPGSSSSSATSGAGSSSGTATSNAASSSSSRSSSSATSAVMSSSASAGSSSAGSSSSSQVSSSAAQSSSGPAPVQAQDDAYNALEDTTLTRTSAQGVLSNDSSTLGAMTAVADTQPAHGTLNLQANGGFTYSPALNFHGMDTFTYHVTSGGQSSAVATVTLSVASVNDTPTPVDDAYAVDEDALLTVTAPGVLGNDSDVDMDSLTAAVDTDVTHGVLVLALDGSFTYTPAADFNGTDQFTYTLSDGTATATGTVTLTVNPVPDAPVAVADSVTALLNTLKAQAAPGVLVNDTDADGDTLTAELVTGPAHAASFTLNADGSFNYQPANNYVGADSFTYRAKDPGGLTSATTTVTLTVVNNNVAPTAVDDSYSTAEDTPLTVPTATGVAANDTDPEGATLAVTVTQQPAHGLVNVSPGGGFTYTPAANYNGADSFKYTASDGLASSNEATVSLTITPVNDPPVAVDDTYSTAEDNAVGKTAAQGVLANDTDVEGATLTASMGSTLPHLGNVVLNADGSFTYTPTANLNGQDTFTYVVSDGALTATGTVTINVQPINDTPVASAASFTTAEDTPHNGTVTVTDPDVGDTQTVTVVTGAQHGTVVMDTAGSYTYTPAANYNGPDSFTYHSVDSTGATSNTATVTITVTPVNDAPVAVNDGPYNVIAGFSVTVAAPGVLQNDTDVDGDVLTATGASTPTRGSITLNANGSFTYTPTGTGAGTDSVTYRANDGTVNSAATATISFAIAANRAPTGVADAYTTQQDTPLTVSAASGVLANDTEPDGQAMKTTGGTQPSHGTVTLNADGSFTYTPASRYAGLDAFTYLVTDGVATTAAVTVSLTVRLRDIELVSKSAAGVLSDAPAATQGLAISDDGLACAFTSTAQNLVTPDANAAVEDVFQRDGRTGTVTRLGDATLASTFPALSADGARLAFLKGNDVYLHDAVGGTTTLVSHTPGASTGGNGMSSCPAISANGRYVAFVSLSSDLVAADTGGFADVFVVDANAAGADAVLVSARADGTQADGASLCPVSVSNGGVVAFATDATNLDTVDGTGSDVFTKDTVGNVLTHLSLDTAAGAADGASSGPSISPDGALVAFSSVATDLVTGDTNGKADVFLWDGGLTRISNKPGGAESAAGGGSTRAVIGGDFVAFLSDATDLVASDTNGATDAFVYDMTRALVMRADVSAAGVAAGAAVTALSISHDGRYLVFNTGATNLVSGDTNGHADTFVAPNPAYVLTGP